MRSVASLWFHCQLRHKPQNNQAVMQAPVTIQSNLQIHAMRNVDFYSIILVTNGEQKQHRHMDLIFLQQLHHICPCNVSPGLLAA